MLKFSIAIYGFLTKGYVRLLLKDDDKLWQNEIPFVWEGDYYSIVFNDKSYVISRHVKSANLKGIFQRGYHVLSIAIPRGWYVENWQLPFDQLEQMFMDALDNADSITECKLLLLGSKVLSEGSANWILREHTEQFRINLTQNERQKKGLIKYAGIEALGAYFHDAFRRSFKGYDTLYLVEDNSIAVEKFVSMKLSEINELPEHDRFYSVMIEYFAGQKKLGDMPASPCEISSLQVPISAKINVPNYEEKIIKGSLAGHWDEWQVKKNADGMGFTLSISLNPKESCYQLKCAELDGAGVEEYSQYITTTVGFLSGKELILKGNEISKEFKIKAIQKDDKIVNFVQNDHVIEFQLRKYFILVNKRLLKALEKLGLVGIKAELLSSKDNRKISNIDLNKETSLDGIPSNYNVRFVSDYHKDYILSVSELNDRPLPNPIPIEKKLCLIIVEGYNINSVLKNNKIDLKYRVGGGSVLKTLEESSTNFYLAIPYGRRMICYFNLKGYESQVVGIDYNEPEKIVVLKAIKSKILANGLGVVVKNWGIPLLLGIFIGWYLVEWDRGEASERETTLDNIPHKEAKKDLKEAGNKVEKAQQEVNQAALEIQAKEYIECLSGIDFTQDDVNKAKKYYDDHVSALSQETEKLLRSKIGCAEYLLKACKKGFGAKSVQDILKNSYSTFLSEEQKSILNFFITQQQSCSQVEGKSLREKQINLKDL